MTHFHSYKTLEYFVYLLLIGMNILGKVRLGRLETKRDVEMLRVR